ncbi:TIM barrel protein [Demetria terragena]|uniref:TIM barrel protein n=1 Tax=Demetria terragena TaxID=63959 RepID=UPI00037BE8A1|nr:TIM barrel protein [Demetria terragena]
MSLAVETMTADVADLLYVQTQELDWELDLRDQGMDSVRIMELVERWRQAGVAGISFRHLAEDRRFERWVEVVSELQGETADPTRRKTCMATVSLGGSLEEKIEAIAGAGFDSIELVDADLRASSMSPAETARRCADVGLGIDFYQPFRRAEGVSDAEFSQVVSRFRMELAVMASVGCSSILVVSNTDGDADPDRARSVHQLATLADVAAEHDITVTFEALAWGTHIGRFADALDVVRQVDHPALSVTVDTFHLISRGDDVEALREVEIDRIGLVQIADAPWRDLDLMTWSRNHRGFPGEGDFDLRTPLAHLLAGGYQGPLSLEIFNPRLRELPPTAVAARGARALRGLIEDAERPVTVTAAG